MRLVRLRVGTKYTFGTKEVLGMSDMSFLVYGMLFDRLPADWTNAFWNIGDHCLLWPCEINEYTLLMQRRAIVVKGGIMAKTNDWICFSFNWQKFPKPEFFFFFRHRFEFFLILSHRKRNPRNRTQIETRFSSIVKSILLWLSACLNFFV